MNEKIPQENIVPRTNQERMEEIYKVVQAAPPASSPEEAHNLVEAAFEEVEKHEAKRMHVQPFVLSEPIETNNATRIYVQSYPRHMLLIGENGSIEIRLKSQLGIPMMFRDEEEIKELDLVLSKPGKNGRDLWGN